MAARRGVLRPRGWAAWMRRVIAWVWPRRRRSLRDPLGPAGERAAGVLLRRAGYKVMARNVRLRAGEADLVCLAPDRKTIVVVEVKARRRQPGEVGGFAPELSITARKRRKLLEVTRSLVRVNRWTGKPVRIDVVAIDWPPGEGVAEPELRHYEDAVRG